MRTDYRGIRVNQLDPSHPCPIYAELFINFSHKAIKAQRNKLLEMNDVENKAINLILDKSPNFSKNSLCDFVSSCE